MFKNMDLDQESKDITRRIDEAQREQDEFLLKNGSEPRLYSPMVMRRMIALAKKCDRLARDNQKIQAKIDSQMRMGQREAGLTLRPR